VLHDKGGEADRNIYVDIHGEVGSVEDGFREADAIHEMTYETSRVQHVHLETHGTVAWKGEDGRLHVCTERVGGGFGGKQEMLSEDLCVLAALETGRPVMWELTREEQFIGATT